MVIVNIKKEDSKKAFKKEAVFKVPKIKGYPTIRIEKGCDFQRNTNFSYSSQPLTTIMLHVYILFPQNVATAQSYRLRVHADAALSSAH